MKRIGIILNSKGFTAIEAVVTIALIVTVVALLSSMAALTRDIFQSQGITNLLKREMQTIMASVERDVRMADSVVPQYPEDSLISEYSTAENVFVLRTKSLDSQGLPIDGKFDYIIYMMEPQIFRRLVICDSVSTRVNENKVLSKQVKEFDVLYDGTTYSSAPKPVNILNAYIKLSNSQGENANQYQKEIQEYESQTEIMVRNSKV